MYTSLLLLPFRNRVSRCYLSSFLLPFYFSLLFILFHWNVLYIFSFYQVMAEFWGWFLIILCFILDIPSFVIIVIMIIISFIVTFLIFILPGTVSDMEKRPLEVITIHYQAAFFLFDFLSTVFLEKAMAPHSSTLAWKIPWTEEPGRLQSMGSLRVGHDWATSLSLFTFMWWRRKWQPTPVFLPGESQGREPGGLPSVGLHSQTWLTCLSSSSSYCVLKGDFHYSIFQITFSFC